MEKCLDKFQFQKLTIIYVSLVSVVVSWPLKIKEKLFIFDEEKVGGVVYVIKFQGLKLCFLAISLYIWCLISFPLWPTVAHSNKMCWGQATGTPTQGGPGQDRRSGVRSGQRSLVSTKPLPRSLKFNVRRGKNRTSLAIDVLCSIKATQNTLSRSGLLFLNIFNIGVQVNLTNPSEILLVLLQSPLEIWETHCALCLRELRDGSHCWWL